MESEMDKSRRIYEEGKEKIEFQKLETKGKAEWHEQRKNKKDVRIEQLRRAPGEEIYFKNL